MRWTLPSFSHRLRWKLAFSYVLVTLAAIIVGDLLGVTIDYYFFRSDLTPEAITERVKPFAPRIAQILKSQPQDKTTIALWLEKLRYEFNTQTIQKFPSFFEFSIADLDTRAALFVVTDMNGKVIAADVPENEFATNWVLSSILSDDEQTALNMAVRDGMNGQQIAQQTDNGKAFVVTTLRDENNGALGILFVRLDSSFNWAVWWRKVLSVWKVDLGISSGHIAVWGLVFGIFLSWQLTKRLNLITEAASSWGNGDFTVKADARAADELGQLARSLNQMADGLRDMVALRQNLAALEERNRLARDLHDTVKQHIFALTMQIGAAQAVLHRDTTAVQVRLSEAEKLAQKALQELVTLIRQLRPQSQNNKSLTELLNDYLSEWAQQTGISVDFDDANCTDLPVTTTHAFFRIAQEALANIARHSKATNVNVKMKPCNENGFILIIEDNGIGFDSKATQMGFGLQTMRERAEALPDGWFSIENGNGIGVRVKAGCLVDERIKKR